MTSADDEARLAEHLDARMLALTRTTVAVIAVTIFVGWFTDPFAYRAPEVVAQVQRWRAVTFPVFVLANLAIWLLPGAKRHPALMCWLFSCVGGALVAVMLGGVVGAGRYMLYGLYTGAFASFLYAGALLPRVVGTLAAAAVVVGSLLVAHPEVLREPTLHHFLGMLAFACVGGVVGGHLIYLAERESFLRGRALSALRDALEVRVAERTAELRLLSSHLSDVLERERERVSHAIHEELGQTLGAARSEVEFLTLHPASESRGDALQRMRQQVDATFETSRRILGQLRPRVLDDLGLPAAVEWLCADFRRGNERADCVLRIAPPDVEVDAARATALFRIVQECLTNASRHADARCVVVDLEATDGALRLSVEDDGCGLPAEPPRPGAIGMLEIRERAWQFGGTVTIDAPPGGGTRVVTLLPRPANGDAPPPPVSLDEPAEDAEDEAFEAHAAARTLAHVRAGLLGTIAAILAWWPLDQLLYRDRVVSERFVRWRVAELAVMAAGWLCLGHITFARRSPGAVLVAAGVAASVVTVWAFGDVAAPGRYLLYGLLTGVFATFLYTGPLERRVAGTLAVAASAVAALVVLHPDSVDDPTFFHFVATLAGACFCGTVGGHIVFLPTCEGFLRGRALARLTGELDGRVRERTAELRALSSHLSDALERERERIARDIHDELGQTLAAARFEVELMELRAEHGLADESLRRVGELVDATFATARRIVSHLRPKVLDDFGLVRALEWLCEDFRRRTRGVDCALRASPPDVEVDAARATALFRIVQECLTNASRHAGARAVVVEIDACPDGLRVAVTDDGCGLDASPRRRASMGMVGMRERALQIGGTFATSEPPGGGTRVEIRLPGDAVVDRSASR